MRAWIFVCLAACSDPPTTCESWHQWGNSAEHEGASCVAGQALGQQVGDIVYDPFIFFEVQDAGGDLSIHYQAPLLDGDDIFMMSKGGMYTPCKPSGIPDVPPACFTPDLMFRLNTQVWSEGLYRWADGGGLYQQWQFDSDWKPEPFLGFEPTFQPVLDGGTIVVPGFGGALWMLDRETGEVLRHITPFGDTLDPDTYTAGGITLAPDGTLYYNAIKLDHLHPYDFPAQAWLVAVGAGGGIRTADYATMVPGAPAATDMCTGQFHLFADPLPWPPVDAQGNLKSPVPLPCGTQRPGINNMPAVGADGTIYVTSRAHADEHYAYVIAVNPDLTTKWATSLRGRVDDGCGVLVPIDGTDTDHSQDCRVGAAMGVDPQTNDAPALEVDDDSSSTVVVLPDGDILYGAYTNYNGFRGHLVKLDSDGGFLGTYDFGWDTTPTVFGTADDYKIVLKDNHYGEDDNGVDLGPYYVTELDKDLHVAWQFQSTNTQSCQRQMDGTVKCTDDHPNGFEWCINAAAVDKNGVVYANSEDGTVYAIQPDGTLRDSMFLDLAIGAAYTPVTLDEHGRVFALNSGHMAVLAK